jgi:hypothetical protein
MIEIHLFGNAAITTIKQLIPPEKIIKNDGLQLNNPVTQKSNTRRLDLNDTATLANLIIEWTDLIKEYFLGNHEENIPLDDLAGIDAAIDAAVLQGETLIALRTFERLKAIDDNTQASDQCFNYRDQVPTAIIPIHYSLFFLNTYGTAVDRQLHKELIETCNTMTQLVQDYHEHDLRIINLAHEVYSLAARAKQERRVNKAFEMSDDCFILMRAALFGMEALYQRRRSVQTNTPFYYSTITLETRSIKTHSKENGVTDCRILTKVTKIIRANGKK